MIITSQTINEIKKIQAKHNDWYSEGIISVDNKDGSVHLTNSLFDENFSEYEVGKAGAYIMKTAHVDGIEFFALYNITEIAIDDIMKLKQKESPLATGNSVED